ncbi:MAG: ABC transporter permease [Pseudomonadales bacterium]
MQVFRAIWLFRGFILGSVRREFTRKYVRSVFGFAWSIFEPLSMILVYTLIFTSVMQARLPGIEDGWSYSIYLCAGIVTWGYFAETLQRCQTVFLDHASLLKKSSFPRITLPLIVLISTTINFLIIFSLLIIFLLLIDRFPGPDVVLMLPILVIQQMLAIGLGMLTGTLNVFFRDVGKSIGILLTFWFWTTPIVYPLSIVPEPMQLLIAQWNPMAGVVAFYQAILLQESLPPLHSIYPALLLAILLFSLGYWSFRASSADLVDEL